MMGGHYITTGGFVVLAVLHVVCLAATAAVVARAMRCDREHRPDSPVDELFDPDGRDGSRGSRSRPLRPSRYAAGRFPVRHLDDRTLILPPIGRDEPWCTSCDRPVLPGWDHCGAEVCRRWSVALDTAYDRASDA